MVRNLLLFILLFTISSFRTNQGEKTYCNSRFDFCISYPKDFVTKSESENGDGAVFTSMDKKSQLWSYGGLAIEDFDKLEQEFGFATEGIALTYKTFKSNWFIFSGKDSTGNIIYQKTVKKKINYLGDPNTYVFQTLRISYPSIQSEKFDSYCKIIARSF